VAVALVTWMIFWMATHARALKHALQSRLDAALAGTGLGIVLAGVVSVAREGIESALFIWATVNSTGSALSGTLAAMLGILTSLGIAWLLYRGMVRINLARFFTWSGAFLVVVAAGVLSYAVGELQAAGALPGAGQAAISLTAAVPPSSWYGTLLAGIFNFTPEPTWAQLLAWSFYLIVVGTLFAMRLRATSSVRRHVPATASAA
jgi:high-affinity iron transporter